jgi:hypothetical protein
MARQQAAQQVKPLPHQDDVDALVRDAARKCAIWLDGGAEPLALKSFDAIEDYAVRIGDAVTRGVMQQALEQQANQIEATVCCCGTPLEERDPEPRDLTTRRGPVGWKEPFGHCPRCRRDFFPSVPSAGDSAG